MSLFRDYFNKTLRLPWLFRDGALAQIVKGGALALDQCHEDCLWLRDQFVAGKCEDRYISMFARARGARQKPHESDARFRSRVVYAWIWAMLAGKTFGMAEVFKLYGFADLEIIEGLPPVNYNGNHIYNATETYNGGERWAMFQVGLDLAEETGLASTDIALIRDVIEQYKPARSKLSSISYRAPVVDTVSLEDETLVVVRPEYSDLRPAGRRYNGSINHDQAGLRLFDGNLTYDGAGRYNGWLISGETYDNVWDELVAGIKVANEDTVAVPMTHAGHLIYCGSATYGHSAPAVMDGIMDLIIVKYQRYDSRYKHGGAHYDGGLLHDNAAHYYSGLLYSGSHRAEEALL